MFQLEHSAKIAFNYFELLGVASACPAMGCGGAEISAPGSW